jgi:hypothetical protein
MTMNKLNNIIVNYIENNKTQYNIEYFDTIETLYELLEEIKDDYEGLRSDDDDKW